MRYLKTFENIDNKLKSTDEYIKLIAKEDYVIFDGRDGFYHIKKTIPKGQSIFLSNYYKSATGGDPINYPYIVCDETPDYDWGDKQGWISKKNVIKYFE